MKFTHFNLTLSIFLLVSAHTIGQNEINNNTTPKEPKDLKNTIRFNLSNRLLFGGKTYIFGYERVIFKNQTASIGFGTLTFPAPSTGTTEYDNVTSTRTFSDEGYHGSFDYRFYLGKLNRYSAPRGIYIGPYYTYNLIKRSNQWKINSNNVDSDITSDLRFEMQTFGFQLGYQFVFWRRFSVDAVLFGPGIMKYKLETEFNNTMNIEDKEAILQKINETISEKIPGYSVSIDETSFQKEGYERSNTFNFRYLINVGFRF